MVGGVLSKVYKYDNSPSVTVVASFHDSYIYQYVRIVKVQVRETVYLKITSLNSNKY